MDRPVNDCDRLEQTIREFETFVYAITHDMCAPIRAVSGFSRLILDRNNSEFDPKTREQFGHIIRAGEEMQAMLAALTEYSRLTTRPNQAATIAAQALVQQVVKEMEQSIQACQAQVFIEAEDAIMLHGDIPRLQQLFQCLMNNALTYHSTGNNPVIRIVLRQESGTVCLCVVDNGIGIPDKPELIERIFRPFGRLHPPEKYPGVGMGLTIARKIAALHQGHIIYRPAIPYGSEFLVTMAAN